MAVLIFFAFNYFGSCLEIIKKHQPPNALIKAVCNGSSDRSKFAFEPFVTTNLLGVLYGTYVQEAAALAATEVAFILQSGQGRGVHFTIAPDSPATPQHEPQP